MCEELRYNKITNASITRNFSNSVLETLLTESLKTRGKDFDFTVSNCPIQVFKNGEFVCRIYIDTLTISIKIAIKHSQLEKQIVEIIKDVHLKYGVEIPYFRIIFI